MIRVAIASQAV